MEPNRVTAGQLLKDKLAATAKVKMILDVSR